MICIPSFVRSPFRGLPALVVESMLTQRAFSFLGRECVVPVGYCSARVMARTVSFASSPHTPCQNNKEQIKEMVGCQAEGELFKQIWSQSQERQGARPTRSSSGPCMPVFPGSEAPLFLPLSFSLPYLFQTGHWDSLSPVVAEVTFLSQVSFVFSIFFSSSAFFLLPASL